MKNIHILKTDKPSRLQQFFDESDKPTFELAPKDSFFNKGVHIYITSSDVVKDDEWFIKDGKPIRKSGHIRHYAISEPGIILTTDPDLIADGVQPIDDEFLQWFIENPTCKFVNIEKEELKLIYNPNYKDFTEDGDGTYLTSKDTPLQTNETIIEDNIISYQIIIPNNKTHELIVSSLQEGILTGAKCKPEKMYSEKDVLELLNKFSNRDGNHEDEKRTKKWFEQNKKK